MNNSNNININELEKQIQNLDKSAVERKLREMGMGDIADKLRRTDNDELMRMLRANPDVIKRVNRMMGGK